jgi:hypothetical protein
MNTGSMMGLIMRMIFCLSLSFLAACGIPPESQNKGGNSNLPAPAAGECGQGGDLIVGGTVEREMEPTNWNEPFEPGDDAHMVFELRSYAGEDAAAPLFCRYSLPAQVPPFEFRIGHTDLSPFEGSSGTLLLSINIYNHAGEDGAVGDLVSEYSNRFTEATDDAVIVVSGLESCDDPDAGGFCTSAQ